MPDMTDDSDSPFPVLSFPFQSPLYNQTLAADPPPAGSGTFVAVYLYQPVNGRRHEIEHSGQSNIRCIMRMKKELARFDADLKVAEIVLMEVMAVKDFDLDKASAAVKKIGALKTAHNLEILKDMKEIRTSLTDDQFRKMRTMVSTETK
jgi:hypothetical protein